MRVIIAPTGLVFAATVVIGQDVFRGRRHARFHVAHGYGVAGTRSLVEWSAWA